MRRFVALHQSEEAAELLKRHPNAFLLLTQIALRARWTDCRISGVKAGSAEIGDWKAAGLASEMVYRQAKKTLERLGLASFRGTNRGTIATLLDSTIYSVSGQQSNDQTTGTFADSRTKRNEKPEIVTTGATGKPSASTPAKSASCVDSAKADNGQSNDQGTIRQQSDNDPTTTNHSEYSEHSDTSSFAPPSAEAEQKPDPIDSPPPEKIHWSPVDGWSGITAEDADRFAEAYPAVTVATALTRADLWLRANPTKARKANWRRFLTNWLAREQERGGDKPSVRPRNPNRILPV